MKNKLIKITLLGKTNAGKSTLINNIVGEKISIVNKKVNTTNDLILGIKNDKNFQAIFYDTPGTNFLYLKKNIKNNFKSIIWDSIESANYLIYLIDAKNYLINNIVNDLKKINESNKPIIVVFNKVDLINKDLLLPTISSIDKYKIAHTFFNISAKYNLGVDKLYNFLKTKSLEKDWIFQNNEISNKDDIFISNECTRNSILKIIHQEIPYNINIKNIIFKKLKNNHIKIKQLIEINNIRYKSILLGKKGQVIKKIREISQKEISQIFKKKVHLYLQIEKIHD
ncbi:MAG: GTPase Era [Alphaproteobacteria bacterium MarineAlpha5_Bin8]|nr:MAG: GTPase Era [Alphaproteobacteria bacterium MarineAlpha5_Bin8]PPR45872.1 MAG: GTPase Era [Alphaproteobacteria bacterium MarineAlpha5_Bin7]PPR52925.1 MAG: GTPase Era [Alphaproteobacteria bacterium MarineAlpha5_Bin6]